MSVGMNSGCPCTGTRTNRGPSRTAIRRADYGGRHAWRSICGEGVDPGGVHDIRVRGRNGDRDIVGTLRGAEVRSGSESPVIAAIDGFVESGEGIRWRDNYRVNDEGLEGAGASKVRPMLVPLGNTFEPVRWPGSRFAHGRWICKRHPQYRHPRRDPLTRQSDPAAAHGKLRSCRQRYRWLDRREHKSRYCLHPLICTRPDSHTDRKNYPRAQPGYSQGLPQRIYIRAGKVAR